MRASAFQGAPGSSLCSSQVLVGVARLGHARADLLGQGRSHGRACHPAGLTGPVDLVELQQPDAAGVRSEHDRPLTARLLELDQRPDGQVVSDLAVDVQGVADAAGRNSLGSDSEARTAAALDPRRWTTRERESRSVLTRLSSRGSCSMSVLPKQRSRPAPVLWPRTSDTLGSR
jgi:hypothetical protein